ncbi:MAG: hypothetical protein OXI27_05365 [Thaumarchaeota archaeon]|nr:hypothetical protein [Nitrososphaerota archaeon]
MVHTIAYIVVAALYVQSVIPETHQRYDSDERVRAFNDAYGPGGTVAATTSGGLWSVDSISYSETRGTKSAVLVIHIDEHDRMELNCYDDVFSGMPVKSHSVDSPSIDDIASSVSACGFSDTGSPIPP